MLQLINDSIPQFCKRLKFAIFDINLIESFWGATVEFSLVSNVSLQLRYHCNNYLVFVLHNII